MEESSLISHTLDLAEAIQQIPAPTFAEAQRASFVKEKFIQYGLKDVGIDLVGNVAGRLPGALSHTTSHPIVLSAHLDTVFPVHTDLNLRRTAERIYGPGIGDNSLGVAGLISLAWKLGREKLLQSDCWLATRGPGQPAP